ncbi:PREDICTED: transcription factor bHLH92 [Fragaria vesca subsp. vesca]|uniref:transcription factor bHLH92 n=1 Tax=Fragaria vesca subsp. vesca TaxID=101020 RepID=UPI0002C2ED21|nr:PREDICTED: transcription factor bHLH92 [Fragaria vesca subsp. vesca]
MDQFIREALEGDFLCYENPPVLMNPSAFVPYSDQRAPRLGNKPPYPGSNSMNVSKRMVQFLRNSCPSSTAKTDAGEKEHGKEKGFRHMINERMRREKQKQGYFALHSLLPNGTKSDKNWIVQVATTTIEQLERQKDELRKRNMELESILCNQRLVKWSRIRLRVANPTSGVDSMMEVLKCLKSLGLKTRNIQSSFSPYEFSAEVEIESKIGGAVVEAAMQETLHEVERKLLSSFPHLPGR